MLHYYYYIHFGWQGEQKLVMTLIVIRLDTTQLCTELIVCDWNCQDFFVLPQKPDLCDWSFCFVIKIKHQIINAIQCLPWWAGPFGPFVSLFSFKMVMLTLRFILWDNFIDALFEIKSKVSDKKSIWWQWQWMSALSGALILKKMKVNSQGHSMRIFVRKMAQRCGSWSMAN